ncbi:putative thioredoxin-like protein [Lupinus albus]|uniref:Putative thioredoxin-like protein n=1 Tax=Lupinus albus TaxID=3870 RepID=A0A6A4QRX0_LUPAL|nr:putative thioredoxin-like protein [Lupinus albus]
MSRLPFFSRSRTIHIAPSESPLQKPYNVERNNSVGKFYDSMLLAKSVGNSTRWKMIKNFCNVFKPKSWKSTPSSDELCPSSRVKSNLSRLVPSSDELCPSSRAKSNLSKSSVSDSSCTLLSLPEADDRIVVYFTSLRGIRRTFEDCNAVLMILKGFRVWVDERDVSMDIEYRKELQCVMGEKKVSLPQVFIRGKYIGGADVIKHLFEYGELGMLLEGFPKRKPGYACDGCGDMRFVPCFVCNGSRKLFDEDERLLKKCLNCNENGLIRCPDCCY